MTASLRHLLFAAVVVPGGATALVACSSGSPTPVPYADGWGPTGSAGSSSSQSSSGSSSGGPSSAGGGTTSTGSSNGGAGGTGSGATSDDAGSPGPAPDGGGGLPPLDAGTTLDASPPQASPPGSCANPNCGTDTNECGCQATDSAGEIVLLGCQAGGQCVCLVNNQPVGQPFPEDNACSDAVSTRLQFLTHCACQ